MSELWLGQSKIQLFPPPPKLPECFGLLDDLFQLQTGKKLGIQTGDTETHVYFETEDIINANRMLCFSNLNLFYGSFNNVKLSWSREGNAAPYLEKHTTMCSLGGRHHDFDCDPEKIHSQPVCPENELAQIESLSRCSRQNEGGSWGYFGRSFYLYTGLLSC